MIRLHGRSWLVAAAAALCLAFVVAAVGDAGTARAQSVGNGLEEQSVNSFEFDPGRGVVRVTVDITLRNVTTDRVDGNFVNQTFFDGYFAVVPLGAENIVATRNGNVLAGELLADPEFPAFSTYRFPLGSGLFSGQSTTLQVTYDHLGAPPRDRVPWRVNEAYAGFAAFGIGDEGLVTVRISQPFGYEFDEFTDLSGFDVSEPDGFGTVVHTRAGLTEDDIITVGMANDGQLVSRQLGVEGVELQLLSWPDDPEWADFAAGRVEAGIPVLEEMFGTPWPIEGSFDVRQTIEPNLSGYAGWFDVQSREIAVGEELDADTIYHELSHAWLNGQMSPERWFTEGLAQVYAAELISRDGDTPREPSEPSADDPAARPLTDWGDVGSERSEEEFGYAASFWAVDALIDEIGFERARDVIATLRNGDSPYGAATEVAQPVAGWKRAYDVLVEVGGSSSAGDVFRAHVVAADNAPLIERRDQAANDVVGLSERSAPWELPVGVRNALELWDLDGVTTAVGVADGILEQRTALEAIEASVGVDEPDLAGPAYSVAPAQAAGGVDFSEATQLLTASIDVGNQLQERVGDVAELAATAGATPPELGAVEGVDDFTSGLDVADDQLAALQRIAEVDEQLDSTSGITTWVGRWGSDVAGDLDDARSLVEQGDNDEAIATLESAESQIDDLASSGALRLLILAAIVVLAALVVLIRGQRRGQRRADPAAEDHATSVGA